MTIPLHSSVGKKIIIEQQRRVLSDKLASSVQNVLFFLQFVFIVWSLQPKFRTMKTKNSKIKPKKKYTEKHRKIEDVDDMMKLGE